MNTITPFKSKEELVEGIANGAAPEFITFFGSTPGHQYSGFGQGFPAPFTVAGISYPTAKHWMMTQKAVLFNAVGLVEQILAAPANELTELGRTIRGFDQEVWDREKYGIVVAGNLHKFQANPDLLELLLSTEGAILVNAAAHDDIWGTGINAQHQNITKPDQWYGQNLLGFALMEVRTRLYKPVDI